ncbi:MAG: hypothetical protein IJY15_09060 [Thermoguttaceae bacterium]|nr:hypothetical protein [Thermoguttaceae bacterium]
MKINRKVIVGTAVAVVLVGAFATFAASEKKADPFAVADKNADGVLDKDEFAAYLKATAEKKADAKAKRGAVKICERTGKPCDGGCEGKKSGGCCKDKAAAGAKAGGCCKDKAAAGAKAGGCCKDKAAQKADAKKACECGADCKCCAGCKDGACDCGADCKCCDACQGKKVAEVPAK